MPGPDLVVPSAPVVIPVGLAAFAAMVWLLRRDHALTIARTALALVTCIYGAALLRAVLLPFPIQVGAAREGMAPWHAYLQLVPLYDSDLTGYVLNVALFVPLGALLPLVAQVSSARRAVTIGLLISLVIELLQLLLVTTVTSGRVADIDDLLTNTLGTLIGFAAFRAARRIPALARLFRAATWPARQPVTHSG